MPSEFEDAAGVRGYSGPRSRLEGHMPHVPHALQRVAIARALVVSPRLIVCDEPVSALDVSVRSSVLNLLNELRLTTDVALVFIAHDLSLVRFLCDEVGVMNGGRLVEYGPTAQVLDDPHDAYTRRLLEAQPLPDPVIAAERRVAANRKAILEERTGAAMA